MSNDVPLLLVTTIGLRDQHVYKETNEYILENTDLKMMKWTSITDVNSEPRGRKKKINDVNPLKIK